MSETISHDGQQMFEKSLLHRVFDKIVHKAYVENTDTFILLLEEGAKHKAMMNAIGELLVEYFK